MTNNLLVKNNTRVSVIERKREHYESAIDVSGKPILTSKSGARQHALPLC